MALHLAINKNDEIYKAHEYLGDFIINNYPYSTYHTIIHMPSQEIVILM